MRLQTFEAVAVQCNAVALSWQAPKLHGQPPMHKYKLERLKTDRATDRGPLTGSDWTIVSENLDDESTSHLDMGIEVSLQCSYSKHPVIQAAVIMHMNLLSIASFQL